MVKVTPDMKLRISATLRRQIEEAAKRNNRTMNGEITARLEWSFQVDCGDPQSKPAATRLMRARTQDADPLDEIEGRIAALENGLRSCLDVNDSEQVEYLAGKLLNYLNASEHKSTQRGESD